MEKDLIFSVYYYITENEKVFWGLGVSILVACNSGKIQLFKNYKKFL